MGKFDIRNMELYYGDFQAIKGIDLSIPEKEITAGRGQQHSASSTGI